MIVLLQILVGLLGGVATALQGAFSGAIGQRLGDMTSILITYVSGGVLIGLIAVVSGGSHLGEWRSLPWYAFLAGPMGLVIVGSLSYTVPRLGATGATVLFILSWLACSAVLDQFGWFGVAVRPLDGTRALGLLALLLGAWLVVR